MPFIDLNKQQPDTLVIPDSDIVIIGAGTAGLLLAVVLTKNGKSVSIVETGGFYEDEEKQKLNTVEQTGKNVGNAVWGRKRAIGGTTIIWGGQSLPFTNIDFEKRDWVQNSGWPISLEDLEPYNKKANSFMGIDTLNYSSDIFSNILLKDSGIDPSIFDLHISKWAEQPNFYLLYKTFLEENVNVFYNAQVIAINKNKENVIDSIEVANFSKDLFTIPVKKLIIAAGTIESVRLLLNNNIGNSSGLVGKYFMEHPCIKLGTIKANNPYKLQRFFNIHFWKGKKYSIRLSLNRSFQVANKLLNCSASIMFSLPKDAYDPYNELKSLKKDFSIKRLLKLSGSAKSISKSLWAYFFDRFYYKANAAITLSLMMEQEPTLDSYISTSKQKDDFGINQALVNWKISEPTWHTTVTSADALKKEIERSGFGDVILYPHINSETKDWSNLLSDVCHHMGGCRMSALPEDGVVDSNLKVWNEPNVYVCSQAVFPTSSHSNPVLTMLALGYRLADHLCKKPEPVSKNYAYSIS